MPTRRILELTVVSILLMKPVEGLVRLWATKALRETRPGSLSHGTAELSAVIVG